MFRNLHSPLPAWFQRSALFPKRPKFTIRPLRKHMLLKLLLSSTSTSRPHKRTRVSISLLQWLTSMFPPFKSAFTNLLLSECNSH